MHIVDIELSELGELGTDKMEVVLKQMGKLALDLHSLAQDPDKFEKVSKRMGAVEEQSAVVAPKRKRTKNQVLRIALHYAMQWSAEAADSMKGCPDFADDVSEHKELIEAFRKLREGLKNK